MSEKSLLVCVCASVCVRVRLSVCVREREQDWRLPFDRAPYIMSATFP